MNQSIAPIEQYTAAFEQFEKQTAGKEPDWLHQIRKEAFAYLQETGFPNSRMEEWRHTNLSPLLQQSFQLCRDDRHDVAADEILPFLVENLDAHQLVFINGRLDPKLSDLHGLPEGVRVESIASLLQTDAARLEPYLACQGSFEGSIFAALNTAFMQDGAYIYIPKGAAVDKPIHFLYYSAPNGEHLASHPRSVIVAGQSSQAVIIESYAGRCGEEYFTNAVTEVALGPNASIEQCKLQRDSDKAYHMTVLQAHLDRDSRYKHHSIILGGGFVRNDIHSILDAEGIHCTLNGLSMADGNRHIDNHTWIRHAKPNCESHELYKGILDDKSSGVFKGQIYVAKDAQKTDAKQANQTLLLSDEAEMNSMPQLEIYADDVKCTHGATTGQLDDDAIFYLQSRGVNQKAARSLLTYAFANEIVHQIGCEPIRGQLDRLLHERLPMA
ncbi:MAG: Fe-S cluster assembly protein SufD [Candidatus Omnitrophica bacterium]|nr:Fe-S cluster assembly protein SufD [Candidatus Omnitrophota bacterium]